MCSALSLPSVSQESVSKECGGRERPPKVGAWRAVRIGSRKRYKCWLRPGCVHGCGAVTDAAWEAAASQSQMLVLAYLPSLVMLLLPPLLPLGAA